MEPTAAQRAVNSWILLNLWFYHLGLWNVLLIP